MDDKILDVNFSTSQYVIEEGVKYLVLNNRKYRVLKDDEDFSDHNKKSEKPKTFFKYKNEYVKKEVQYLMENEHMSYEEALALIDNERN